MSSLIEREFLETAKKLEWETRRALAVNGGPAVLGPAPAWDGDWEKVELTVASGWCANVLDRDMVWELGGMVHETVDRHVQQQLRIGPIFQGIWWPQRCDWSLVTSDMIQRWQQEDTWLAGMAWWATPRALAPGSTNPHLV